MATTAAQPIPNPGSGPRVQPAPGGVSRSSYWDTWKGCAILAVIGIHACDPALSFPIGSFTFQSGILAQQVLNFAVGVFLALSGYLSGYPHPGSDPAASRGAPPGNAGDAAAFWKKRFARLVPPYLAWTAIAILVRNPRHFLEIGNLARDVLAGTGIGIGYYVIVLIQFIAITPLLARIRRNAAHFLVIIATTLGSHALLYHIRLRHPEYALARFPYYALPFPVWYPFYHLGLWIRQKRGTGPVPWAGKTRPLAAAYLLCLLASILECEFLAARGFVSLAGSQIKLTSLIATVCLVLIIFGIRGRERMSRNMSVKALAWLGKRSYPIYLSHLLFLGAIHALAFPTRGFPVYVAASALASAALCVATLVLAEKWIPAGPRSFWLGI